MNKSMTLVFANEITFDTIPSLIDLIEKDKDKHIDLYLTSSGGGVNSGEVLTDYFNYHELDLTLIANWSINSTAFEVFFKSTGINRRIMPNTHAVIHLCRRDMSTIDITKKDTYDNFLFNDVTENNERFIKFITELGVEQKHIDRVLKGEDVVLTYEELSKLL